MSNTQKKLYELGELLSQNGGPIPMSLSGIYAAVKKGTIPSVKVGGRVFIPSWYVDEILCKPGTTAASGQ